MVRKARKARAATPLNIKDPEAHRLAATIAQETGESLTQTVISALRTRFRELPRDHADASLAADLRAIGNRAAAHMRRPFLDHGDYLYDSRGLPK